MSRMTIAGQVLYSDLSPVDAARVTILDLDGAGGAEDDRILRATTDGDGRFSGTSSEWRDREGQVFGVDAPDVLRLEFSVVADGRRHRGPFLRLDARRSAPIVLPFGPTRQVGKSARELVQVILLSDAYTSGELDLYAFIESATEGLTTAVLGGAYRRVTFLKGASATLPGLVSALRAAATRPGTEAVDLLFTTHGKTDAMVFAEGELSEATVLDALLGLPDDVRAVLRVVFSTACFGATHLDTWTAAGFSDASGAEGIYADSAVSYAPFLAVWAAGRTFAEAVAAANAADVGDAADGAARAYYRMRGETGPANRVDSDRVRAGSGTRRIHSRP